MNEVWVQVKDYEGDYEVSDCGNVRSLNFNKTGKVVQLSKNLHRNGYHTVLLTKNKTHKRFYIHRLVWEAFCGSIPDGYEINHKNEIKTDNRKENLECITHSDNCNYGNRNNNLKKQIILTNSNNEKFVFDSCSDCSKKFNYKNLNTISTFISRAKKKGKNTISLRGVIYYFAQ